MDNYLIHYIDKEGDYSKCHVDANSPEEAESKVRNEYWDIDTIQSIQKR
jgi:type II secretory pathway component PulF